MTRIPPHDAARPPAPTANAAPTRRDFVRTVGAGALLFGGSGLSGLAAGQDADEYEGIEDVSFDTEANVDVTDDPVVEFDDGEVVIESGHVFPQTCYAVDVEHLAYDESSGVLTVVTAGYRYDDFCGDAETAVPYELRITPTERPEAVLLDEAFDAGSPIARYPDGDPEDVEPEVVDYEFELVSATDVPDEPTIEWDGEEAVLEGTVTYGSSTCNTLAFAGLSKLETGHVAAAVAATSDPEWDGDCTDDEASTGYRLTLESRSANLLRELTVLERHTQETRLVSEHRYDPALPDGVLDYELETGDPDEVSLEVEDDPVLSVEERDDHDAVVVEGVLRLSSGSCRTARLTEVAYASPDHLALRIDDAPIPGFDDVGCTTDAPPIYYECAVTVESLPATITAAEGSAAEDEPLRSATIDVDPPGTPGEIRTDVPDGVSVAFRYGEDAHDHAVEPPSPAFQWTEDGFVAYGDYFAVDEICSHPVVDRLEFASEDRRHVGVTVADASRPEDVDCAGDTASERYALRVTFDDDLPRTAHVVEDDRSETENVRVFDRGHEPDLDDGVVDYELTVEDGERTDDPEPAVSFEGDSVAVEGTVVVSNGCRDLALQAVEVEEDGEHVTAEIGSVYAERTSPFEPCPAAEAVLRYELVVDFEATPEVATVVEDGGDLAETVTVSRSACAATETVDGQTVCDLDGDGNYMDVDASGDLTSQDLQVFFQNQHRDPWDGRDDLFDFDGDGTVGQPDVVALFEAI